MGLTRSLWLAVVVLAVAGTVGYTVWKTLPPYELGLHEVRARGSGGGQPTVESCPVFPADNVWNTPVETLPTHRKSSVYVASIGPGARLHPDLAPSLRYGIPFTNTAVDTPTVPIDFQNRDESDAGPYRIPPDAPIEGRGQGDAHVIAVDQQKCILYELYAAAHSSSGWSAGSGIVMDLRSNALRPAGMTSADAAGLPIFPGLVRYDEVAAGEIRHALRFTAPRTQAAYVWPARHAAGLPNANLPPMGMRFRLRADFDVSSFSRSNRVILTALQKYGMFLADNGGALYLSGVSDKRWSGADLKKLARVTAEDFEAVDEAGLELEPNSAQVNLKRR
ncbi:MAG: hypothetical protein ACRYGF_06215 [Janthinobacterium lividum]